jgi:hypothetical protein
VVPRGAKSAGDEDPAPTVRVHQPSRDPRRCTAITGIAHTSSPPGVRRTVEISKRFADARKLTQARAPRRIALTKPSCRLLRHVGPAQRDRLDLSEDILASREAQLLPGFLGYACQEPRASAVLTQGHGRQDFVRVERIRRDDFEPAAR